MPLKYTLLISVIKKEWFVFCHQTGSHQRYLHKESGIMTTLPFHKELQPKTAKSILHDIAKANNKDVKEIIATYNIKL